MTRQSDPLSLTLLAAARCLADVESGRSLTDAVAQTPAANRSAVQAVTYYAMRHWGLAQAWRAFALKKAPSDPMLNSLAALGLLLMDIALMNAKQAPPDSHQAPLVDDAPCYAPHTVVDQAVAAVSQARLPKACAGLINAVLRRFQRERAAFVKHVQDDPVARWGYPAWWQKKIKTAFPGQWQEILQVSQTPPALVLRVNRRRADVASVLAEFERSGVQAHGLGDSAIVVRSTGAVGKLPGFAQGLWSVQDLGAQRAATLLPLTQGSRVLDACAAPGGKAAHLLELANIELTALDSSASRLARVQENLERLGLMSSRTRLVAADARQPRDWWDGKPFDAILADVPCTASGVVRRHPDIAWLRRASDVAQSAALAREILDSLWPLVAPGGRLLLVTCSVFPEEGEQQACAMQSRHNDAIRLPAPGQCLPSSGDGHQEPGEDGFFYALFERAQDIASQTKSLGQSADDQPP
jgi:16S rRNA (cytosine967-C5)-methyltransferase